MHNNKFQKKQFKREMSTQAKRRKDKILREIAEEQGVSPDNVVISLSDIYSRRSNHERIH